MYIHKHTFFDHNANTLLKTRSRTFAEHDVSDCFLSGGVTTSPSYLCILYVYVCVCMSVCVQAYSTMGDSNDSSLAHKQVRENDPEISKTLSSQKPKPDGHGSNFCLEFCCTSL